MACKTWARSVWMRMYQDIGVEPKDVHESQWRWAKVDFNNIIYNDLGIDELRSLVKGPVSQRTSRAA